MKSLWRRNKWLKRAIHVVAVICVAASMASGQTFRATILGSVTDITGATVPGAKVTARNTETGFLRTTETQADGSYRIPELPIGNYDVTVEATGFQAFITNGVQIAVADVRRVDAPLKPGQVNEQILVEGSELPQIETTSDTLGGTLTQETVKDLPV